MSDKRDDIVNRLQTLGHPASEFLPDGKRLTLLIQCSHGAADEIERLRAELAACKEQENAEWVKAIAERDALRVLLREARGWMQKCGFYGDGLIAARIDAALKGGGDE